MNRTESNRIIFTLIGMLYRLQLVEMETSLLVLELVVTRLQIILTLIQFVLPAKTRRNSNGVRRSGHHFSIAFSSFRMCLDTQGHRSVPMQFHKDLAIGTRWFRYKLNFTCIIVIIISGVQCLECNVPQ